MKNTILAIDLPSSRLSRSSKASLSVKLGGWFHAYATETGVIAVPGVLVRFLLAMVASVWLG